MNRPLIPNRLSARSLREAPREPASLRLGTTVFSRDRRRIDAQLPGQSEQRRHYSFG
jgi:hypothetical protein